ncbi:hypothetical protein BH20ACI3_BH20ACI3_40990 [soil metagenome]
MRLIKKIQSDPRTLMNLVTICDNLVWRGMKANQLLVPAGRIEALILMIRGHRVLLRTLAAIMAPCSVKA